MGGACSCVEELSKMVSVLAIPAWMENIREAWGGVV